MFLEQGLLVWLFGLIPLRADRDLNGKETQLDGGGRDRGRLGRDKQEAAHKGDERYAGNDGDYPHDAPFRDPAWQCRLTIKLTGGPRRRGPTTRRVPVRLSAGWSSAYN